MVKTAQECGLERYQITFEGMGRVRLTVGLGGDVGAQSEPNDFDQEFG
jgi:hypothetical protein